MLKKIISVALFVQLCILSTIILATHPQNFEEAKKQARIIWSDHRNCVYSGCKFDKNLKVDFQSCGYEPKNMKRAERIEWEHIVPVSWFERQRICWQEPVCEKKNGNKFKGRNCCELIDPEFRRMYTDLHNLIPVIGEVHAARKDYRFGEFYPDGKFRYKYHGCEIFISNEYHTIEPRAEIKCLIARTYLYMAQNYSLKLSETKKRMFNRWNAEYPPSEWEVNWNNRINQIQGNDNKFISEHMCFGEHPKEAVSLSQ